MLRAELVSRFRAGERLPSERQLAATFNVSPVTIARVLRQLGEEGVVYRVPSSGTYLCDNARGTEENTSDTDGAGRVAKHADIPSVSRSTEGAISLKTLIVAKLQSLALEIPGRWTHDIMSAVERAIQQEGGSTTIMDVDFGGAAELVQRIKGHVEQSGINSIVILSDGFSPDQKFDLSTLRENPWAYSRLNRPFPIVDAGLSSLPNPMFDSVGIDGLQGVHSATRYLVGLGHRRLAFVGPHPTQQDWVAERVSGFELAARASGLTRENGGIELIFSDPEASNYREDPTMPGYACGADAARRLFGSDLRTAIVAANDNVAMAVWDAAIEHGLNVPGDLSIIGYDDRKASGMRGLTTIHPPIVSLGSEAAKRVIALHQGLQDISSRARILVAPTLIVRASTRPPRTAISRSEGQAGTTTAKSI
jgi:DNA-binding LacI/PurR family transcriptional regulator